MVLAQAQSALASMQTLTLHISAVAPWGHLVLSLLLASLELSSEGDC